VLHESSSFTIDAARGSASPGGLRIIRVSLCAGSAAAVPDGYRTNPPGACSAAALRSEQFPDEIIMARAEHTGSLRRLDQPEYCTPDEGCHQYLQFYIQLPRRLYRHLHRRCVHWL